MKQKKVRWKCRNCNEIFETEEDFLYDAIEQHIGGCCDINEWIDFLEAKK
jgi:hypothetical protein